MIPAIDPGIGLSEENIKVPPAPSTAGNDKFTTALRNAEERSEPSNSRGPQDKAPPGDTRARSRYGDESTAKSEQPDAAADEEGQVEAGQDEDSSLEQAAGQLRTPHLKRSDAEASAEDMLLADPAEGEALSFTDTVVDHEAGEIEDQTPINAQIGTAAWRLGRHGNSESQAAAAAGMVLPGSAEDELAQAASLNAARKASLEEAKVSQGADDAAVELASKAEAHLATVELSEEAKGLVGRKGLSTIEQIKLDAAQSRNKMLSQIVAVQDDAAAAAGLDTEVAQNFLRERLAMNGVFSRSARAAVETLTEPQAPVQMAAPPPGTGSVDFAQVFETPMDEGVQQRVLHQVASEARWMISNNKNQVTLKLSPEHLGNVNLKVIQEDGSVLRIEMKVDTLAAKSLLENHLSSLRERLASENLAENFTFNVDVRKDHQQSDLQARQQPRDTTLGTRLGSLEMAADAGTPKRVMNHSGLSIYA